MKHIIGAGGGDGGSSRTPIEEANNLQSTQYAQILDLVSEGEIHGLADGLKSIFLDETPIENKDGTKNFSGVSVEFRPGTQHQEYIKGFPSAQHEVEVGVEVKKADPVVRMVTNPNISALNVKIVFPQMVTSDPNTGDIKGASVRFAIERSSNGSGWVTVHDVTVTGKTTSKFVKAYRVELPGEGPHSIRVTRITAEPTTTHTQNKIYFGSYSELIESKLRYPNSAIFGIRVDAAQFSSIPTRAYDLYLLKIKVPSNYNPWTREYAGIWDGSFKVEWSNNPAWIFYDLVTNDRYGLGAHIDSQLVDKWTLYKIARYCDEIVPDGFGGLEPRFAMNVYLQTRDEAYNVLQNLASAMRAMVFWASGLVTVAQDSPDDVAHLFTPSNVVDGNFTYSGSSAKNRYTVALVTWNDPADFCKPKIEYVEDAEGIAKHGVVQSDVVAFGCTSRGQAHRVGKWLLYTSRSETETVLFQTGLEAAVLRPGQVVKIHDPARAGTMLGGRLESAEVAFVVVDRPIKHISNGYELEVMLPSGKVEKRKVTAIEGKKISFAQPLSLKPHKNAVWILRSTQINGQLFRIVAVSEEKGKYSVVALAHNPSKFQHIEQNLSLESESISVLRKTPEQPTGLKITETLYESGGEVKIKVTFSWAASENATAYVVGYRKEFGNQIDLGTTRNNEVELLNIEPGRYEFQVQAISMLGAKSAKSILKETILGKAYEPEDVKGFSLVPMGGVAYLSWEKSEDLDVLLGGAIRIRHSSQADPDWKHGVDVALLAGSATRAQVPLMNGTYMAKFVDSMNVPSNTEVRIYTDTLAASKMNVVRESIQHPNFPGVKHLMHVDPNLLGLCLSPSITFDEVEDVDDLPSFDFLGSVAAEGSYQFAETVDLGGVLTANLKAFITVDAIGTADDIDARAELMDEWKDFDGAYIDTVNAELQFRSTNDDPEHENAHWSVWKRFFVGEYTARAYQFRVIATSTNKDHTIVIKTLSISVDVDDRTINLSELISDLSGSSIQFEAPFYALPAIGVTIMNQLPGEYADITNRTVNGFDITIRNAEGTPVQRVFDVLAKGYGRVLDVTT